MRCSYLRASVLDAFDVIVGCDCQTAGGSTLRGSIGDWIMKMGFKEFNQLPVLETVLIYEGEPVVRVLSEGKWIRGRFDSNIRIDQPTHGVGQTHAHVLGRKGEEIGVVNFDGSSSHGTKCRLSDKDADALRAQGFQIKPDNIVEWLALPEQPRQLLLG